MQKCNRRLPGRGIPPGISALPAETPGDPQQHYPGHDGHEPQRPARLQRHLPQRLEHALNKRRGQCVHQPLDHEDQSDPRQYVRAGHSVAVPVAVPVVAPVELSVEAAVSAWLAAGGTVPISPCDVKYSKNSPFGVMTIEELPEASDVS